MPKTDFHRRPSSVSQQLSDFHVSAFLCFRVPNGARGHMCFIVLIVTDNTECISGFENLNNVS